MNLLEIKRAVRSWLKHLWFEFLMRSGLTGWASSRIRKAGAAVVLTFHRVLDDHQMRSAQSPAGMLIRRSTFVSVIGYLSDKCELVSVSKGLRRSLRQRVVVTFDDGWLDNFHNAIPVLKRVGAPGCVFVCSQKVGQAGAFWPEQALSIWKATRVARSAVQEFCRISREFKLSGTPESGDAFLESIKDLHSDERNRLLITLAGRFPALRDASDMTMSWSQLRNARNQGIDIGSHSKHHEILTRLTASELRGELRESKQEIERELGHETIYFSYPNGSYNQTTRREVAAAGYQFGFINSPGIWEPTTDPLLIPRVNLSEEKLTYKGGFSRAAAEYFVFWLPYRNRGRSRLGRRADYLGAGQLPPVISEVA